MDEPQADPDVPSDLVFFLRLLARAALHLAPQTPLTAREFARVMGVRVLTSAQRKPDGLAQTGRSKRAPFREWLERQGQDEHAPSSEAAEPSLSELRRRR